MRPACTIREGDMSAIPFVTATPNGSITIPRSLDNRSKNHSNLKLRRKTMHQMSPGVERAVSGARSWAERLGSEELRLSHFILALLDEEEGRPAVLLERAGLSVATVRESASALTNAQLSPPEEVLFNAARNWSLAYRHDPEFLTDALLLAVLRADQEFERVASSFGLNALNLEKLLTGLE